GLRLRRDSFSAERIERSAHGFLRDVCSSLSASRLDGSGGGGRNVDRRTVLHWLHFCLVPRTETSDTADRTAAGPQSFRLGCAGRQSEVALDGDSVLPFTAIPADRLCHAIEG